VDLWLLEIRAKLPCARGTWPAIWMLGATPGLRWPQGGEIDIMEHVGHQPGIVHQTVHTASFNRAGERSSNPSPHRRRLRRFHDYQLD
jgi:beta-glucanase (GH16 family)